MLNKDLFASSFTGLCEVCERDQSDALTDAYFETLKNLTDEQFRKAIGVIMQTNKYKKLPMPAEILEAACGNIEDKAVLALAKVREAIDQHGAYETVVFVNDPEIHMVVEAMGGWEIICDITDEDWKFQGRKEFIALYKAFLRNPKAEYPEKLIGYHEKNNTFNGLVNLSETKYIGSEKRQKQIENNKAQFVRELEKELERIGG